MSTDTNFKIDADQSSEALAKGAGRNDLTVSLHNNIDGSIKVLPNVEHGFVKFIEKDDEVKSGGDWKLRVKAAGAGSNAVLNVTMPNGSGWAIMAATPVNKSDYFRVAHSKDGYKNVNSAKVAADRNKKHYHEDGVYSEDHNGYKAVITISGRSPATCNIVFKELG